MLFMAADGQTVKSVCRYQQYRAVNRAIHRAETRVDVVTEEHEAELRRQRMKLKDGIAGTLAAA